VFSHCSSIDLKNQILERCSGKACGGNEKKFFEKFVTDKSDEKDRPSPQLSTMSSVVSNQLGPGNVGRIGRRRRDLILFRYQFQSDSA
jgi:hypothetical protein